MPSISVPTAVAIASTAVSAGTAIAGAVGSGDAASNSAAASNTAAGLQYQASQDSLRAQQANLDTTRANLAPYLGSGNVANAALLGGLGLGTGGGLGTTAPLTSAYGSGPPQMTPGASIYPTAPAWDPSQVAATPGYQFALEQGLEAAQNGFAAKGLGNSGAAQKGAAEFAQGLASTTYQQQFANYQAQHGIAVGDWSNQLGQYNNQFNQYMSSSNQYYARQQQLYNMLGGVSGSGQNAAAGLGALSLNSTNSQAATIQAGGNYLAGGVVGAANAANAGTAGTINSITNGLGGVLGAAQNYAGLTQFGQAAGTNTLGANGNAPGFIESLTNNYGYGYDAPSTALMQ